jgi:hypothetical protein
MHLNPGEINVQSTDTNLRANGRVSSLLQFMYSPTGERIAVEQVHLGAPGDIFISGEEGSKGKRHGW